MRITITIFILFISVNHSFAQGTYTDTVTGMSIDYSVDWEYKTFDNGPVFYGPNGNIEFTYRFIELDITPDDFTGYMEMVDSVFNEELEVESDGQIIVKDGGRTMIGNIPAYYANILVDNTDESDVYRRARIIIAFSNKYKYHIIIYPHENLYDEMIIDAESFLENVRFP